MSAIIYSPFANGMLKPFEGYYYREEFRNGSGGLSIFSSAVAGGSTNTTINPNPGDNREGVIQMRTGVTAAIDQRGGFTSNLTSMFPGDGNRYYVGFGIRPVAPFFDGTLTGFYQFGFTDVASSIGNGSLGFFAQDGSNWLCRSANSGALTVFDTGLPVSNTWRDFGFLYYENGSRVDWFSDGVRIMTFWATAGTNDATNIYSANINTTTNRAGIKAMVHRTSATGTQVSIDLDYFELGCRYSSAMSARFLGLANL